MVSDDEKSRQRAVPIHLMATITPSELFSKRVDLASRPSFAFRERRIVGSLVTRTASAPCAWAWLQALARRVSSLHNQPGNPSPPTFGSAFTTNPRTR